MGYWRDISVRHRRNPGRFDGVQYNASYFICPVSLDGRRTAADAVEEIMECLVHEPIRDIPENPCVSANMTVSLLDMARPAKRKGIAKEFEIVERGRRVLVLEDDDKEVGWEDNDLYTDDDWEDVSADVMYTNLVRKGRKTYSEVLRGNDR